MKSKVLKSGALVPIFALAGALVTQPIWAEPDPTVPEAGASEVAVNDEQNQDSRDQDIAQLVTLFESQIESENAASQLNGVLSNATPEQLAAAGEVQNLDELNAILVDPESNNFDGVEVIGDSGLDYSYTPVTPCRIVDTRVVGGAFAPNVERPYYVYGALAGQGGTICNSPVGEPRGVALNITVVPVSGQGNVRVYPYNVTAPNASLVNYKSGVQNIANAAQVKTYYLGGPQEIKVKNFVGTAHVIIDVLGYYQAPLIPAGAEYAGGDQHLALTSTDVTARSISVYTPSSAYCVINASGYFELFGANSTARCSITTGTTLDFSALVISKTSSTAGTYWDSWGATRGYSKGAGTTTYRLVCDEFSGTTYVDDTNLTAICTKSRY